MPERAQRDLIGSPPEGASPIRSDVSLTGAKDILREVDMRLLARVGLS